MDNAKYKNKDSLEKDKYFLNKLNNMSTDLGRTLTEEESMKIWNHQSDDMCRKADFAHQQITTAAILATAVLKIDGWQIYIQEEGGKGSRWQT